MKILVISDQESKSLWDHYEKSKLEGIDLILSCGDLSPKYLSFLATFSKAPVLYIHGNHDGCYQQTPPEGCTCIDDDIFVYQGVRILGLGGSMKYKPGPYQFSEAGMKARIVRMSFKILKNRGFDILLTHAPAAGIHDMDDMAHKGFECFVELIKKYKPAYFIHGHVHMSYGRFPREEKFENTIVVNAFEKHIIEFDT
ncbi:MAG: metallophosphoesterase family protein [Thermoflexaceae bacterium]|nr:metallophosphoesterase family protein [Thermoflexaceae bacterium]